jgi:cell shape-determining protein MreC
MNYHLTSNNAKNRRRASRQRTVIGLAALLIIIALAFTPWARRFLHFIAAPIWQVENSTTNSTTNLISHWQTKQNLLNEISSLQARIFEAGQLEALNKILETENNELKSLLGRPELKQDSILSAVLVKPPKNIYDVLTIDAGSKLGVKVGDKVLAESNVYLGEVREVFPDTAKVVLYSSPGEKRPVSLGENGISAESVGQGGGNFSIILPRDISVKEGDVIVVPSITSNVFGIVEKINLKDKDSFQTILFKSPVNISELHFVQVLI